MSCRAPRALPGVQLTRRVLELGTGKGDNLAPVAFTGASAIDVGVSAVQVQAARERFGDLIEVRHARAEEFLVTREAEFDSVYSVFGAVRFTDPAELLSLVRRALKPRGRFAFSHLPPSGECLGPHRPGPFPSDHLIVG